MKYLKFQLNQKFEVYINLKTLAKFKILML